MENNHAIITGGSSGIGLAIAKLLINDNYSISLIARNKSRLSDAKDYLINQKKNQSQMINIFPADVTNQNEIKNAVDSAVNISGVPDLLITSAGAVQPGYFSELNLEVFEKLMAVNYFGTIYIIKAALPYMRNRKKGHIIMISSAAGLIGIYGYSAYTPTKFALSGFAQCLRSELRPDNIYVSIVFPPDTDTPQFHKENQFKPPECKQITNTGGLLSPEEVAKCVLKNIRKKRFMVTPGLKMTLLARLNNLISPLLHKHFDSLVDKYRQSHKS